MAISIIEIIVAAVVGGVASLIAPWANWGVEKRKKKLLWRKKLIDDCKDRIDVSYDSHKSFRETHLYSNLRPYLSDELKEDIEAGNIKVIQVRRGRGSEYPLKQRLLDEINILEKKWGLI